LNELQKYVAGLPASADFDKMSEADKGRRFADKRRWALVYYSLSFSHRRRGKNHLCPSRGGFLGGAIEGGGRRA